MSEDTEWVLLVECYNMAELHTLRATLEAHGVPCRIHGEHTHGIFGPIQGAMARSRVLVPRRALAAARELAEDIVGPFDERPEPGDDAAKESPFRTAAELEPTDAAEPPAARPKSYAVLVAVAVLMLASMPLAGVAHLYVHRNVRGGILLVTSVFSITAFFRGAWWAPLVLNLAWIADFVGGAIGIAGHNRRINELPPAPESEAELEPARPED
jgi:uncharacterized membrane protein